MLAPYILFSLLGLCVGSFLNVLIYRLPKREKVNGRSYCPYCKKSLKWHELIPVLSFILLKGKCSSCKKPISLQYPLVELMTGFLFFLTSYNHYFGLQFMNFDFLNLLTLFFLLGITSCLIVIFVSDFRYYMVPDEIIYSAIFFSLIYQTLFNLQISKIDLSSLLSLFKYPILSALGATIFFLLIIIVTKGEGMGLGDAKVAFFMGLFLSYPNIIIALFITFLSGSIIGLILIAFKKKNMKSKLPLATFLSPATYIVFFWGENIINFYVDKILQ